jgi:2-polyprenyl-3-methyl-5-hydroxy-6-metoxy-1,4-benzoquinol methylase
MRSNQTTSVQRLCRESSRYEYVIPDYEQHPDVYSRNWILLEWVGSHKRVLELGCSTGFFSKYLRQKRACSVVGVEVDPLAAAQARKFCNEVLLCDLNSPEWIAGLPMEAFDVVLMGDVLEHLIEPQAVLEQIQPMLAPNASIIISLPNVVYWGTRLKILFGRFEYESFGILDHTHLRFYTPKTARKMIESAGYEIRRFHPVFGGPLSGYARPVWQRLANWFPGVFAGQLLFEAKMLPGTRVLQADFSRK